MEWTLGITDKPPSAWRSAEPLWRDETVVASSSHCFRDVMGRLCETAIKSRRQYDHGIDEHLWNMKITSMKDAMNPPAPDERLMRMLGEGDSDDGSGDGSSDGGSGAADGDGGKRRGNVIVQCPLDEANGGYEDFDDPDARVIGSSTMLSPDLLPEGSCVHIVYDYGTTTNLYLKVLSVKAKAVQSLLQYFTLEADSTEMANDLESVPAYKLPEEKRVDSYFPYASKAFLGDYIPLFTEESDENIDETRKAIGCVTVGLSAKLRSDDDTVFCTMEDRTQSRDLLFCPAAIEPNELLQVIDKAWEPRDRSSDRDGLHRYSYDWINRWVVAAENQEDHDRVSEMLESEPGYGSKNIIFRLARDRKRSGFEFEKVFPRTYGMLRSGKFRWFQFKRGILRVNVGRGVGVDSRQFESKQVLRTWKRKFTSFHEMLCAVEASWVWEGQELVPDTVLPEFDTDLGPSMPLPKEPPCYGEEEDAVVISKCSNKKKLVTALAISEELGGKTVLYSGHDDGTLAKWSLDNHEEIWSKRIYADGTADYKRPTEYIGLVVHETPGVAGIAVRPGRVSKESLLYTWTDAYDGYPENSFDERGPSTLKVWSGGDGGYLRQYTCDVGYDTEDSEAHPSISSVVFCKVYYKEIGSARDSIIVGLHCCCNALEYDETFSDFNLKEAQEFSEGNLVPFLEHSSDRAMPTWRGQGGIIKAMAVIEDKYLLSLSIRPGHGLPACMVLWSLDQAGVPLFRKDFWDSRQRNVLKQQRTRMREIAGISIDGMDLLITDYHGDRIVLFEIIAEEYESPSVELRGYASIGTKYYDDEGYHGRMASSHSRHASVAMEIDPTIWIFRVQGCSSRGSLDTRDGNHLHFDGASTGCQADDGNLKEKRAAREIAVGKVRVPPFGSNPPSRKKQRLDVDDDIGPISNFLAISKDEDDGLGRGGPVQLAMRGRQVVAGFSNGSLAKFMLPETFKESPSISSNHLMSCGSLPSDEWHVPVLQYEDY